MLYKTSYSDKEIIKKLKSLIDDLNEETAKYGALVMCLRGELETVFDLFFYQCDQLKTLTGVKPRPAQPTLKIVK